MSSIRSSKGLAVAVAIAVALVTVGTATAITYNGSPPEASQPDERVTMTANIENPFEDVPVDEWELQASTELTNASWSWEQTAQGDSVDSDAVGGDSFTTTLASDDGTTDVSIEVTGTVPDIENFNYDDPAPENFSIISLHRVTGDTSVQLQTWTVHRYTDASQDARQAIDDAIDAVGSRNDKINDAIDSYNGANFDVAQNLAEEAESGAESSQLLLIVIGVVVVLALVGGGVYYWRQQRQPGNKLQ